MPHPLCFPTRHKNIYFNDQTINLELSYDLRRDVALFLKKGVVSKVPPSPSLPPPHPFPPTCCCCCCCTYFSACSAPDAAFIPISTFFVLRFLLSFSNVAFVFPQRPRR
jgi:hypothetical protein